MKNLKETKAPMPVEGTDLPLGPGTVTPNSTRSLTGLSTRVAELEKELNETRNLLQGAQEKLGKIASGDEVAPGDELFDPVTFFDLPYIEKNFGDLQDLWREIFGDFLNVFPKHLEKIHQTINNKDFIGLTAAAHACRGVAANVGIQSIAATAKQIELDSKAGKFSGLEKLYEKLCQKQHFLHQEHPSIVRTMFTCKLPQSASSPQPEIEMQKALQEREAIINGLKDIFIEHLDADMKLLWMNDALKSFSNNHTAPLGNCCFRAIWDSHDPCQGCAAKKAIETGLFQEAEVVFPNGHTVIKRSNPLKDENGKVIGVINAGIDITRRKQAEERLQIFSQAVEQSPASVLITDPTGRIEYVNSRFVAVTGYSTDEAVGQNPRILKGGDKPQEFYQTLWKTIQAGQDWRGEFQNRKKSGELYWEMALIRPIVDGTGKIIRFLAIKENITERKCMEESLLQAKEAAEAAAKAKGEFLANMSHEIRTPISAVLGLISLALETPLTEKQQDLLRSIQDASESLLGIINDILDFSRIEAGRIELSNTSFSLKTLLESTIHLVRFHAQKKGLTLTLRMPPPSPDWIKSDPARIRQILLNLLGNAIKFTQNGSIETSVAISSKNDAEFLQIIVKDTGIGIPPDKQHTIFEMFTQADASTSRRFGGTGLGLTISRSLARLLVGDITVESMPGQGATFTMTIPLHRSENPAQTSSAASQKLIKLTPMRILLAEDSPLNLKYLTQVIRNKGHTIFAAINGLELVNFFRTEQADLIIADISMPELDGIAAMKLIRASKNGVNPPTIPAIALTAHALQEDREKILKAGFNSYLSKPVTTNDLINTIAELLPKNIDTSTTPTQNETPPMAFLGDSPPHEITAPPAAALKPSSQAKSVDIQFSSSTPPLFDMGYLRDHFGDLMELWKELVEEFMVDLPKKADKIKNGLAANDIPLGAKVGHALKGSAGTMGVKGLAELASRVDQACRKTNAAQAQDAFLELEKVIPQVLREMPLLKFEGTEPSDRGHL